MKIESNIQQVNIQKQPRKTPHFSGWADTALRFLDTNQAWGANAVDFGFMVLPRTATDFTRGADAGWETARRESMGTINDSSVGGYGLLAGLALATGINSTYGLKGKGTLKAGSIFADAETIDMLGNLWHDSLHKDNKNPLRNFLRESWKNYEALSPNEDGKWVKLNDKQIDKIVDIQEKEILKGTKELSKEGFDNAKNFAISALGVENNYRITAKEGAKAHTSRYNINSILESTHKLGVLFNKDTIKNEFKNANTFADVNFTKALKAMNLKRSLIGVGIGTAVGMSTQPINMYLTKLKTGSDAFVGGGTKDDSAKFKMEKAAVAALFGAGVLASIGNPKNLVKDLQFKGFTPTIKQLKFIYGATIISRFLAARNENELKESSIKDILGFTNWLILGNFVQKLVVQGMDKSKTLIKKNTQGSNKALNWIQNSFLKTRDEVLHEALKEKAFDKSGKALSFNQMMKAASSNKDAMKKIKILTIAQLAGYAYSGLVLGLGIPKLNIYLTNRREAKKKAAQEAQNIPEQNNNKTVIQPVQNPPAMEGRSDVNIIMQQVNKENFLGA